MMSKSGDVFCLHFTPADASKDGQKKKTGRDKF